MAYKNLPINYEKILFDVIVSYITVNLLDVMFKR